MIRDAVTCDRDDCMALYLERDDMPEGVEFEDDIAARGWVSRPAVLAVPGRDDADVLGHTCPACVAGRGPVLELGECPTCTGRTVDLPDGSTCHYCGTVTPYPPDDLG
ncbi:hypothetical protein [Streptomyces sp. bgisy153]|uniref:hypothetical protein n=1 Tax=Streptomyces sp. bgisy153 TaxID=3413793 RepID=UPI003D75E7B8